MTQKYVDGLPLARQEKMWAREGISLSRATMANWVIQCAQTWLKPLYRHMKQELLTHSVIHADETVVQVLKEDGKPATSQSRMWLYASAALLKHQVRLFEYQPDRSGKRPEAFLKGFTGALVTDGYQAYNLLTKVTHCGCWAHARRKWREAMPEGATVKTSKAAVGFQYCNKLFAQERKCAAYKPKYRQEYRQNKELPLLEEYYAWLKTLHPEKGSKLEEAVRYSLNQKQPLTAFLNNGEVPISNNLAENAIRPFTLGRKNWLFCDTTKGAEASAIVYSLVESAKANGVEPFAYRKAGYSKKFLAEHEPEIILHKAAKQFFDEQGLKKLPTVKSLQTEYAQLLSEKKAMYADYQKAREDMRSLQTAKANVDRILGDDSLAAERETEKYGR